MKRKTKDLLLNSLTYLSSFIAVVIILSIIIYLLINGLHLINSDLLLNDYYTKNYVGIIQNREHVNYLKYEGNDVYSERYGIAFKDVKTNHDDKEIAITYIDENSVFNNVVDKDNNILEIIEGNFIKNIYYINDSGEEIFLSLNDMKDASNLVNILDNDAISVKSIAYQSEGGGIRGSIITTFYLIIVSLIIALPIGVSSAIYLHEYAKKNKLNRYIKSAIDTLNGIPSIIYGLMGVSVLFPITQLFNATSTSILLGALTLAIILIPTIIKSCEEALICVPQSLKDASLSLGATKSQTIFKVVLPSCINGILTGVLLSVGRVIGESAALVYTTSTVINDNPNLLSKGTSLSLMIYTIMSGEKPNFELASAISLIILIIVFGINIIIKIIAKRFNREFA